MKRPRLWHYMTKKRLMKLLVIIEIILGSTSNLDGSLYGLCGSRKYRRFGRRATDVKNGNAGPKLHWLVWEKRGFQALLCERYFLAENKGYDGDIWAKIKLFVAYCL